jgi:hypothetical protein
MYKLYGGEDLLNINKKKGAANYSPKNIHPDYQLFTWLIKMYVLFVP